MYLFDPWFGILLLEDDTTEQIAQPALAELRRSNRYVGLVCAGITLLIGAVGMCMLNA